jgi:hypothetical protein
MVCLSPPSLDLLGEIYRLQKRFLKEMPNVFEVLIATQDDFSFVHCKQLSLLTLSMCKEVLRHGGALARVVEVGRSRR